MSAPREAEALDRTAADLRRQGYEVELDFPLVLIDKRFGSLRADIFARRDDEMLVIEVKGRGTAPKSRMSLLDSVIQDVDHGIRFEVLWVGDDDPLPSAPRIGELAARARILVEVDKSAALLLAWASLEGGMRICASREAIELRSFGRQLLADLYGNRIITFSLYGQLDAAGRARNLVAHGSRIEEKGSYLETYVQLVTKTATLLAAGDYISVDDAVDLMRERVAGNDIIMLTQERKVPHDLLARVPYMIREFYDLSSIREIAREVVERPGLD